MRWRLSLLGIVALVATVFAPLIANPASAQDVPGTPPADVGQPVVDTDGDGATDEVDNCAAIANAGQVDADADGAGDACDDTPNGEAPPLEPVTLAQPAITEAACDTEGPVAGSVSAPASTDSVTYSEVTAQDNGDGSIIFTFTATLAQDGTALPDSLPGGYTRTSETVATYAVTLPGATCAPEMSQAADFSIQGSTNQNGCAAGYCVGVSFSAPDTVLQGDALAYTLTFTNTGGTPIGTLDPFVLNLPGSGWSITSQSGTPCSVQTAQLYCNALAPNIAQPFAQTSIVVSRTVTEACHAVITSQGGEFQNSPVLETGPLSTTVVCESSPQAPAVTNGACIDGAFVAPSIKLAETAGITYGYSPNPLPFNGAVIVTATLETGHVWGATDWTIDPNTNEATLSLTVSSVDCDPALSVTKTVTEVNGNPATDPVLGLAGGDVVTYQIVVTNTGSAALASVSVSDPAVSDLACDPAATVAMLAPGGAITCAATHAIDDADLFAGSFTNTASASGSYNGSPISDSASVTVMTAVANPSIILTKTVDPTAVDAPGTVTYWLLIANNGNVALTGLSLEDDLVDVAAIDCDPAPGVQALPDALATESYIYCSVAYAVTQAMLDGGGSIVNQATVSASAANEATIESSSSATLNLLRNPGLAIEKSAATPAGELVTTGTTVTYTFTVTNTGNVTVSDIAIADALAGLSWDAANPDGAIGSLAPGASATATATYVITDDDVALGKVTNFATSAGALVDCKTERGDCVVTSDPASVTVQTNALSPADPTPAPASTPGSKTVTSLPTTGQGAGDSGGTLPIALTAIALLLASGAVVTVRPARRRAR